jgi:hypothetical protein
MKVKKNLKKSKKSYRKSGKSDLLNTVLFASAGFMAGNMASNMLKKVLPEKTSFAVPLAGIVGLNFVKLPSESAIVSGLVASSLTKLLSDGIIPRNDLTESLLAGEPDVFVLSGDNVDPLGNLMLEENYSQPNAEFVVNGQNSDPLS